MMSVYDYDQWMKEVDSWIRMVTGSFMSEDLIDYPYASAFEDGLNSKDVAIKVLEQNGFDATTLSGS